MTLPNRWHAYARVQSDLNRRSIVNDVTWGLEGGLDRLLDDEPPSDDELTRAIRTDARRERDRARTRRIRMLHEPVGVDEVGRLDARAQLRVAHASTPAESWEILTALGVGADYAEITSSTAVSTGSLRVRVMRMRKALADRLDPETESCGSDVPCAA